MTPGIGRSGCRACSRLPAWLFLIFALLAVTPASAEIAVPPLSARVVDLAETLSAEQMSALETTLAEFEKRKGSQIVVLIVPTTLPESVEQYATRVFDLWKPGRKGIDDGVLLVIAKNDRKLRIEVGYGLEGVLPDAIAKRIIADTITPSFKRADFYGGISAGVERVIMIIDRELLPPNSLSRQNLRSEQSDRVKNIWYLFIEIILIVSAYAVLCLLREVPGGYWGGAGAVGVTGLIAWLVADQTHIVVIGAILAFAGAAALIFIFPPAVRTFDVIDGRMRRARGYGSRSKRSLREWTLEPMDSGSSGSGSGGSSFGGGGGDSGGGGASGSW